MYIKIFHKATFHFQNCKCNVETIKDELRKSQGIVKKLSNELEEFQEKHSLKSIALTETEAKYENLERNVSLFNFLSILKNNEVI